MSECEELNTLKEKLNELKETVVEMTDTISAYSLLQLKLRSVLTTLRAIKKDAEEKAQALENNQDEQNDVKEVVKELVEKAENWDYGLKGWRTLETKQDLINYLKKEVLEA